MCSLSSRSVDSGGYGFDSYRGLRILRCPPSCYIDQCTKSFLHFITEMKFITFINSSEKKNLNIKDVHITLSVLNFSCRLLVTMPQYGIPFLLDEVVD